MCFVFQLRAAWKKLRAATMCVMCQLTVARKQLRVATMYVISQLRVAGKQLRAATMCVICQLTVARKQLRAAAMYIIRQLRIDQSSYDVSCVSSEYLGSRSEQLRGVSCVNSEQLRCVPLSKYCDVLVLMLYYLFRVLEDVKKNLAKIHN